MLGKPRVLASGVEGPQKETSDVISATRGICGLELSKRGFVVAAGAQGASVLQSDLAPITLVRRPNGCFASQQFDHEERN
jgi:hypothetical protein